MQISGIAVQHKPEYAEAIRNQLQTINNLEIHAEEKSKMVITVEDRNSGGMTDTIAEIEGIEGVLLVHPVYIYDDTTLDASEHLEIKSAEL
ncbi:MAG: chaperone NapD [Gammaproteobacteria bacterium]|jgi:nitrate reductase NapAB chaperone NapD|nr:chaperone NapD [Gammaproteobacteria bacterium]MBT7308681.1 chaperone NapD [Gammaproteobacteria bacterium]